MAKKKEINKDEVNKRMERIAKCVQCKGAPPIKKCNLQGLVFDACDLCLEIVGDYGKEGAPITVTTKTIQSTDKVSPDFNKEITVETIPGSGLKSLNFE